MPNLTGQWTRCSHFERFTLRHVLKELQTKVDVWLLLSKFLMSMQLLGILVSPKAIDPLTDLLARAALNVDICAEVGTLKGAITLFFYVTPLLFLYLLNRTIDIFGRIQNNTDSSAMFKKVFRRGCVELLFSIPLVATSFHFSKTHDYFLFLLIIGFVGLCAGLMDFVHGSLGASSVYSDIDTGVTPGSGYFRKAMDVMFFLLEYAFPLLVSLWVRGIMQEGLIAANIGGGIGGISPIAFILVILTIGPRDPSESIDNDSTACYNNCFKSVFFSHARLIRYERTFIGKHKGTPGLALKKSFWAFNLLFLGEKLLITMIIGFMAGDQCKEDVENDDPESLSDFKPNLIGGAILFVTGAITVILGPYRSDVGIGIEVFTRVGVIAILGLHIGFTVCDVNKIVMIVTITLVAIIVLGGWLFLCCATPILKTLDEFLEELKLSCKKRYARKIWRNLKKFSDLEKIINKNENALSLFSKSDWLTLELKQRYFIICYDRNDDSPPNSDLTQFSLGSFDDIDFNTEVFQYGFGCLTNLTALKIEQIGLDEDDILALSESIEFRSLPRLKTLEIHHNSIDDIGCERLMKGLSKATFSLTSLKLTQCEIESVQAISTIVDYMNKRDSLQYLCLDENILFDDAAEILFQGVNQNQQLEILSLAYNRLADADLVALLINTNLKEITLTGNKYNIIARRKINGLQEIYGKKINV